MVVWVSVLSRLEPDRQTYISRVSCISWTQVVLNVRYYWLPTSPLPVRKHKLKKNVSFKNACRQKDCFFHPQSSCLFKCFVQQCLPSRRGWLPAWNQERELRRPLYFDVSIDQQWQWSLRVHWWACEGIGCLLCAFSVLVIFIIYYIWVPFFVSQLPRK